MLKRFHSLVDQCRHRVYGFTRAYLRDAQTAEDVTQEVFLRLWQNLASVQAGHELGWLMRVASNACHDLHRKRRAEGLRLIPNQGMEEGSALEVQDERPDPQSSLESNDLSHRLETAIGRLAEPYRTIVLLREMQELSYDEIGEATQLPLNTVKVYLHRGRRQLREELRQAVCP